MSSDPLLSRPIAPREPGPIAIVGLSIWCGAVSGLVEALAVVVHKRFLDENRLLGMSRDFAWLIPATDMVLFALVGLVGAAAVAVRPAIGRAATFRILAALAIFPVLLVAVPQVYALAWAAVAVGASIRLVPVLSRHGRGFRRLVLLSTPAVVLTIAGLFAAPRVSDAVEQARERARPIPSGAPNIVLLVMDTVAAGHLHLYGYDRPTSPALDELARRGCRFDAAQPPAPWTLASHASMFTGRWPHELSVGWKTPLDGADPTIAGFLRDRGYATAGFVANTSYCARDSGLARGFTDYRDHLARGPSPMRWSALVKAALDGAQSLGDAVGDGLDLPSIKAGPRWLRERFEGDRKEAAEVHREFLDWLDRRPEPDRPYFAFLNDFDAHSPYQLPPGRIHRFGGRPLDDREATILRDWWFVDKREVTPDELGRVLDAYDDCVASIDEQVGRLLDELARRRALERTWIILVSDHGESFGEHEGVYVHGSSLYQTELHVPMIVVPPPGVAIRPSVAQTVSLRDMAATIADLAGLGAEAPFPGASMAGLWSTAPSAPASASARSPAIAELIPNDTLAASPGEGAQPGPLASMTGDGWSFIRRDGDRPAEELYDLGADPRESRNLAGSAGARAILDRMREALSRLTLGPLTRERFNP